mmetsp:Transcript_45370/g.95210  ORF Transcript_45370/g.95210 Transcript_45370/m.95210 type:complete len:86 (+) Transcript_45370:1258-1515(+)
MQCRITPHKERSSNPRQDQNSPYKRQKDDDTGPNAHADCDAGASNGVDPGRATRDPEEGRDECPGCKIGEGPFVERPVRGFAAVR